MKRQASMAQSLVCIIRRAQRSALRLVPLPVLALVRRAAEGGAPACATAQQRLAAAVAALTRTAARKRAHAASVTRRGTALAAVVHTDSRVVPLRRSLQQREDAIMHCDHSLAAALRRPALPRHDVQHACMNGPACSVFIAVQERIQRARSAVVRAECCDSDLLCTACDHDDSERLSVTRCSGALRIATVALHRAQQRLACESQQPCVSNRHPHGINNCFDSAGSTSGRL